MATSCANGCAAQFQGLRGCLAGLQKPRIADVDPDTKLENEVMPEEGPRAAVRHTESPALISRSQSGTSDESREASVRPTLLTSKACAPEGGPVKKEQDEDAEELENSTVAMTTGNVSEDEGSAHSTPRNRLDCCTAAPALPEWDTDDFLNLSARMGQAAWNGSQEAARLLAVSLRRAAELAEPHVTSLADSATDAIKSAAKRALAAPPPAPELSRSTWEATSHRALTHPCGSAAPVFPDLADFDPCPNSLPLPAMPAGWPRTPLQLGSLRLPPMQPQFDLSRDAQLRYSLPGINQKSQSFCIPGAAAVNSFAGRPQPQRMVSAQPAYHTPHPGYAPQILSAPPSFRLSDGPILVAQVAQVPSVTAGTSVTSVTSVPVAPPEGPLVQPRSSRSEGPTLALAPVRPGEASGNRRPLDRNRVRTEVTEAN